MPFVRLGLRGGLTDIIATVPAALPPHAGALRRRHQRIVHVSQYAPYLEEHNRVRESAAAYADLEAGLGERCAKRDDPLRSASTLSLRLRAFMVICVALVLFTADAVRSRLELSSRSWSGRGGCRRTQAAGCPQGRLERGRGRLTSSDETSDSCSTSVTIPWRAAAP
jgi:hypothetical protein